MIWLHHSQAAALLQVSGRHLRRVAWEFEFKTRQVGRATEYLLESMPAEAQNRYFDSLSVPVTAEAGSEGPGGNLPAVAGADTSLVIPSEPIFQKANPIRPCTEQELTALNDLADRLRQARGPRREARVNLARELGWSVSTLERKIRALDKYGVAGLARKARADRGRARVADDKVVARIKSEYLKPHRPSAASIYREIARDYEMSGVTAPSYSFVRRTIDQLDDALIARFRLGEREFDDKFAYVTMRAKPELPRQWCDADHHLIDHVVEFADGSIGRPWLTAIQDICTNEITGYVVSREKRSTYPGARAIGLTLRKAVLKKDDDCWPSYGIFENFYSDLGKDFRSQYIRAVCHDLGITVRYTRGYHGKSKPIERFFGTLEQGIKHLPCYVGRSPETNPLKAHIGASRDWESLRGEALKIDEFEKALHRWIVNVFHHTESRALKGLSPIGALEAHIKSGWSARAVASERALDLLLMARSKKKVQRYGIQLFSSLHVQRYFMAPELVNLINETVEVFWNPENIGEVIVYKDNRFVCKAQNRELLNYGATEEDLRSERDIKKSQRDQVRARMDELVKQAQYPDPMARAVAENRLDKVIEEEREKIAVNAQAPGVSVLMPKFQRAAMKIAAVPKVPTPRQARGVPMVPENSESDSRLTPRASRLIDEDDLKSSDELFKKPERPSWMDDDDI